MADFQVKHVELQLVPNSHPPIKMLGYELDDEPNLYEWGMVGITISIHEQDWLLSDQTFQIPKMEVQKPSVFSRVYCWKPCWIKQDLKGYTTNKTPTDLNRRSFQESSFSDANCESWSHWNSDRAFKKKDDLPTSFNRSVGQPEGI